MRTFGFALSSEPRRYAVPSDGIAAELAYLEKRYPEFGRLVAKSLREVAADVDGLDEGIGRVLDQASVLHESLDQHTPTDLSTFGAGF